MPILAPNEDDEVHGACRRYEPSPVITALWVYLMSDLSGTRPTTRPAKNPDMAQEAVWMQTKQAFAA